MSTHHTSQNNEQKGIIMHENNQPQVAVVMVPWPSQGHLNQLLHLSRLIGATNLPIHYIAATAHLRQATARVHGFDPFALANLHFHDFPTPPFSTKISTLTHIQEPLFMLINKLSTKAKRVVVIFDSLMASSVSKAVKELPNVESYCFRSISAISLYSFYWKAAGKPEIPQNAAEILENLPSMEECFGPGFLDFLKSQRQARNFDSGTIYDTNRITEGLYLDLLEKTRISKHFAIGPFNPVTIPDHKQGPKSKCLDWLDEQGKDSVIYVSFGTTSVLSDEQVKEIAIGLESSHQRFIWALRDADKGNIFTDEARKPELPNGFEERVKGRGIVVRDWAPQLEILGHFAIGGFLSHFGWNSCMESISMGVPIATWPMQIDQPSNAVLVTKVLRIGLEVRKWEWRNELVSSVRVEEAVKRLMASDEGDEMRERAAKLAEAVKKSMMEGGDTRLEIDSFIAHICR